MAREVPNCPRRPSVENMWGNLWTSREYHIQVITPLFGGGPTPGQNDPVTLIRGASIRGHLRFWWRATRGANYPSVAKLREREAQIWGDTETPSPVQVMVKLNRRGRTEPWAEYTPKRDNSGLKSIPDPRNRDFPTYALFPFQGKARGWQVEEEPAAATQGTEFTLTLRWPTDRELAKDVEAALWAWVNFGGLGARTRRGCGSLFCSDLAPADTDLRNGHTLAQWVETRCGQYGIELPAEPRPWPTLSRTVYYALQVDSPLPIWFRAIDLLRRFRQEVNIGRNPGRDGRRPGRSRWPEADSLRRITGQALPQHQPSITTTADAFPRAEFGLPIIFHFKDGPRTKTANRSVDPVDCQLKPAGGAGRMVSPLIIKALAVRTGQGMKAVPLILKLNVEPISAAVVEFDQGNGPVTCTIDASAIRRQDLADYRNSPLHDRSVQGSAIEGFLYFIQKNGFVR